MNSSGPLVTKVTHNPLLFEGLELEAVAALTMPRATSPSRTQLCHQGGLVCPKFMLDSKFVLPAKGQASGYEEEVQGVRQGQ